MWTSLSQRLPHLSLVLAGPLLRRTEPNAVTVWVALKMLQQVTLTVYATQQGTGEILAQPILQGRATTLQLGEFLHLVVVTATPINQQILEPGQIYAYNLEFSDGMDLKSQIPSEQLSYFSHQLPTLTLPPNDLNHLRLAHGSCRKCHGGTHDALSFLDNILQENAAIAHQRPQQLFLTGDQIYGDDVADALLAMLIDATQSLLGWIEALPIDDQHSITSDQLLPGKRCEIARETAGLTAMLIDKEHLAKSHLFSLGEYCCIYLFSWSPVLWGDGFPIQGDSKESQKEVEILQQFQQSLGKVRRVLANIATYTIFDDHDVTDDWYLNRWWCVSVLSKPLGRRTVLNGLLAYTVFQAWGNTPEQFFPHQPGGKFLDAIADWSASSGTDLTALNTLTELVNLPPLDPQTDLPQFELDEGVLILAESPATNKMTWHYTVRSFKHEVIVLDTRTRRGYPQGENQELSPPMLLCPKAFTQQLRQPLQETQQLNQQGETSIELTLVIIPTNLFSLQAIDIVQRSDLDQGKVFHSDVGDAWNFHGGALSRLLGTLFEHRQQVIILSGDIHYSGAVGLKYHANCLYGSQEQGDFQGVMAQLTSSALNNTELKAQLATTQLKTLIPEPIEDWGGWNHIPELIEVQMTPFGVYKLPVELSSELPVLRPLHRLQGNDKIAWQVIAKNSESLPDWRYQIEWIKRQKAVTAFQPFNPNLNLSSPRIPQLWNNRWFQEGEEIIGYNNISVVSVFWPEAEPQSRVAIQDVYWRAPWDNQELVYSRYQVPLSLKRLL